MSERVFCMQAKRSNKRPKAGSRDERAARSTSCLLRTKGQPCRTKSRPGALMSLSKHLCDSQAPSSCPNSNNEAKEEQRPCRRCTSRTTHCTASYKAANDQETHSTVLQESKRHTELTMVTRKDVDRVKLQQQQRAW